MAVIRLSVTHLWGAGPREKGLARIRPRVAADFVFVTSPDRADGKEFCDRGAMSAVVVGRKSGDLFATFPVTWAERRPSPN